ncbi:MAG: DMT family transporter [Proteobacteria bacterium]|nr:DMT family transporter [Pseudomonadota bacterium]
MTPAGQPDAPGDSPGAVGIALLLSVAMAWGLQWPAMKIALEGFGPWTFRAVSLLLGSLLLLAAATGGSLRVPRAEIRPLLILALFYTTGWQLLTAYGVSLMRPGRAVILAFTMPLWAAILSRLLLGERLTARRLVGLALGLAGIAILIGPELGQALAVPLGSLLILLGAVSLAVGAVLIKYFRWSMPTLTLVSWQMALGSIPIVAGAPLLEPALDHLAAAGPRPWIAVAYTVLIGNAFGVFVWFRVVQRMPVQVAAIGTLLVPVIGVYSSAAIVGDPIDASEFAALALVVAALATVTLAPRRKAAPGRAPPRR